MERKIWRSFKKLLAQILIIAVVVTNIPVSGLMLTAAAASGDTAGDISIAWGTIPGEVTGVDPGIKMEINGKEYGKNDTISGLTVGQTYSARLICSSNYTIKGNAESSVLVNDNTTDISINQVFSTYSVLPKYTVGFYKNNTKVTSDSMKVNETGGVTYTLGINDDSIWQSDASKASVNTTTITASYNVNNPSEYVTVEINKDAGTVTVTPTGKLPTTQDSITITLTGKKVLGASDSYTSIQEATMNIIIEKLNPTVTINVNPSEGVWSDDTVTVSGTAPQAAGTDVTLHYTKPGEDKETTASTTINDQKEYQFTITPTGAGTISNIYAVVKPDEIYKSATSTSVSYNATKADSGFDFEYDSSFPAAEEKGEINLTYGDRDSSPVSGYEDYRTIGNVSVDSGVNGVTYSASVSRDDYLDVKIVGQKVLVKPLKATPDKTSLDLDIKVNGGDNYNNDFERINITIAKKQLTAINSVTAENTTEATAQLTYTGTTQKVTYTAVPQGLVNGDQITLTGTLTTQDTEINASDTPHSHEMVFSSFSEACASDAQSKYELPADGLKTNVSYKINRKSLAVSVDNESIEWQELQAAKDSSNDITIDADITVTGFVNNETAESAKISELQALIDVSEVTTTKVGETNDAVIYAQPVSGTSTDAGTNYTFDFDNQTKGDLSIEAETMSAAQMMDLIDLPKGDDEAVDQHVYKDTTAQKFYYNSAVAPGDIKVTPERNSVNSVYTKILDANGKEIDTTVLASSGSEVGLTVKLADAAGHETKPCWLSFTPDGSNPEIAIQVKDKGILQNIIDTVKYSVFGRGAEDNPLKASISVSDGEAGIAEAKYYLVEIDGNMTEAEINAAAQEALAGSTFSDIPLNSLDGFEYSFIAENNYVLWVYAEDRVGRSTLSSSTGIVIDNAQLPEGKIMIYDGAAEASVTPQEISDGYYQDSADIYAEILPDNTYFSGVDVSKNPVYTVSRDGAADEDSYTVEYDENNVYAGKDAAAGYDYDTLTSSVLTKHFTIEQSEEQGSAVITLGMKGIYDLAGNEASRSVSFILDPVAPQISDIALLSDEAPENSNYFKADVTAEFHIKERFLDQEKVAVSINGKTITLSALCSLDAEGLKAYGIKAVTVEAGSEDDQDERRMDVTISFDQDGTYELKIDAVDRSGNSAETKSAVFSVVKTAPVVTIIYQDAAEKNMAGASEAERVYTNKAITAKVTIKSDYFAVTDNSAGKKGFLTDQLNNGIDYAVTWTKAQDEDDITDYGAAARTFDGWTEVQPGTGLWEKTFVFDKDANYTAAFTFKDLAGNKVTSDSVYFTYDATAPTGSISITGSNVVKCDDGKDKSLTWEKIFNTITFHIFDKKQATVSMTGTDATSPLAQVYYVRLVNTVGDDYEMADGDNWTEGVIASDGSYEGSYTVSNAEQFVPYLRLVDKAGNETYISADGLTTVDPTMPVVTITINNGNIPEDRVFAGDVPLSINVIEPQAGDKSFSGLKSVEYIVATDAGRVLLDEVHDNFGEDKAHNYPQSDSFSGTILASIYNGNDITVSVKVTDVAGNSSDELEEQTYILNYTETIAIDSIAPEVTVSYDNNDVDMEKYFRAERTATVKIKERNFDAERVSFDMTINGQAHKNISLEELQKLIQAEGGKVSAEWKDSQADCTDMSQYTDERINEINITFSEGTYTDFGIYVTDKADNSSQGAVDAGNSAAWKDFVVDLTSPDANAVYDNNDVRNDKYFKDVRTETITIQERNLAYDRILFTATLENGDVAACTAEDIVGGKDAALIEGITFEYGDSQADRDYKTFTNDRVFTLKVRYDEGAYSDIGCHVMDGSGRDADVKYDKATKAATDFVVDLTDPEITLAYYVNGVQVEPGSDEASRYYANSAISVVATIDEHNFALDDGFVDGQMVYDVQTKNVNGQLTDQQALAEQAAKWVSAGDIRTYNGFLYNVDANYNTKLIFTDLAGRTVQTPGRDYFTYDHTSPEGTINVRGLVNQNNSTVSWVNAFINKITFGLFGKNGMSSTMSSSDVTAGVAATEYMTAGRLYTRTELAEGSFNWKAYTGSISLPANQDVIVYEKVTDKSGNVAFYSTENLVADNVSPAPVVTITPSTPGWGKGVYSAGDRPGFDISVTDPKASDGSYAGLHEITYRIVNGSTGHVESGTLVTYDRDSHTQSWTGHVSVDPDKFYSNDVQITVTANDWSTNEAVSETKTIKVDNQAPKVTLAFNSSDALNGKYYKNTKTVTITVDERNFDTSYQPRVVSSTGGGYSFSGWSGSGETHTGVITFTGDGDYSVSYDCYDLAGNKSNTVTQEEFTVDKTAPVINVSYDNNSVSNGKYYKAQRTATITIMEHNFRASEVNVNVTASLNGGAIYTPSVSGWSASGDRHTATVTFPGDGDYTFDISYTDLAGNTAADYDQDSFVVDKTAPEITITGVEKNHAYKGNVAPVITLTDNNFNTDGVTVVLTGANSGVVNLDSLMTVTGTAYGQTLTFRNFTSDMDDIYTLSVKSVDQAGNETSSSIRFSVNRNGSTYIVNKDTQTLLDKGYTNSPGDIIIQEYNVNTLNFIELTYSRNGEIITLKEGVDYTVTVEGGDGEWKLYTYTIKADCFDEEGDYSINIYSEDEAENTTTNRAKAKTISFIVDKSAPTLSIANLDKRSYRESVHNFTVTVKDNTVLDYLKLIIDGKETIYSAEEIAAADGVLTIAINSKSTMQTVSLLACDAAGNATDLYEYTVLVSPSLWVQFFNNKPLFYGSIVIIILAAGLIIFLVVKRRRNRG